MTPNDHLTVLVVTLALAQAARYGRWLARMLVFRLTLDTRVGWLARLSTRQGQVVYRIYRDYYLLVSEL